MIDLFKYPIPRHVVVEVHRFQSEQPVEKILLWGLRPDRRSNGHGLGLCLPVIPSSRKGIHRLVRIKVFKLHMILASVPKVFEPFLSQSCQFRFQCWIYKYASACNLRLSLWRFARVTCYVAHSTSRALILKSEPDCCIGVIYYCKVRSSWFCPPLVFLVWWGAWLLQSFSSNLNCGFAGVFQDTTLLTTIKRFLRRSLALNSFLGLALNLKSESSTTIEIDFVEIGDRGQFLWLSRAGRYNFIVPRRRFEESARV